MGLALLAAGTVLVLLLLGLLVVLLRLRAETRRELVSARAETAELRARLDDLDAPALGSPAARSEPVPAPGEVSAFVITDAGADVPVEVVRERVVLSATLGEPLVKAVALGHGVRRALSAESRNRIRFEMRREVRRTRKQRRRAMKDAWRREQAHEKGQEKTRGRTPDRTDGEADAA
jgi:hypothetical protein